MTAITLQHVVGGGGVSSVPVGIYAFAVPLNQGAAVSSVTLPDVAANVSIGGHSFPALHIFGVAVANTTTATPGGAALSSGQAWTGSWASPTEGAYAPLAGSAFSNETFRIAMQAAAGGSAVRLRLSDDLGWLAGTSATPLHIGQVTISDENNAASVTGTPVTATFGGSQSVVIPVGGDAYTDPIPFTVNPGDYLAVSVYLSDSVPYLVQHSTCTDCAQFVTAAGAGNQTMNTDGSPYSGTGTMAGQFTDILTGVDVETAGVPTAAVLGDNVIDGFAPNTITANQAPRVSDNLAAGEISAAGGPGGGPAFGVVSAGIESNDVFTDQDTGDAAANTGGPSALSRMASDVLAEPGIATVVVDEGLEDLLQTQGSTTIDNSLVASGYPELLNQLAGWGITAVMTSITPCGGYAGSGDTPEDPCTTAAGASVDANRIYANQWMNSQFGWQVAPCVTAPAAACVFYADFESAVSDGASPEALQTADDTSDHVNLTSAGYAAVAATIPLGDLTVNSPPDW
jgi:hypothetical protein